MSQNLQAKYLWLPTFLALIISVVSQYTIIKSYKIRTCAQLQNASSDLNGNYELVSDIDCSETCNWNNGTGFVPIGKSDENCFHGIFNGNKFIISNLYIMRPLTDNVGIFGYLSNTGRISDVGLTNVSIRGRSDVGGLVGRNSGGMIANIYVTGTTSLVIGNGNSVGGLVGQNVGTITNSYSSGMVSGGDFVGGLVGSNNKIIGNSYSLSMVDVRKGETLGGLVGRNLGTIFHSYAVGRVGDSCLGGGLVGSSRESAKTSNSYWDTQTSRKNTSAGGVRKTTEEIRQRLTYEGWDFHKTWEIQYGATRPTLRKRPFAIAIQNISSPQKVGAEFNITLTVDSFFGGLVCLHSERGAMSPSNVSFEGGMREWTGEVKLYSVARNNRIYLQWGDCGDTSISNSFDVTNKYGKINNYSAIIGSVVDEENNPISSANVILYSGYNMAVYTTTSTDNNGNYQFRQIPPDNFYIKIQKPHYQDAFKIIETIANMEVSSNDMLYSACVASDLVPVLLVPGLMGSKSKGLVYGRLPKQTPKWYDGKLKLHAEDHMGWTELKKELGTLGYTSSCTMFDVSYDWTLSIDKIADLFLVPWINSVKAKTGSDKVDIISHSMGGLVARSYIQSRQYKGDVRKLAMIGTPNKGSDIMYYVWAGGDPSAADQVRHNTGFFDSAKYFYTNTVYYLIKDRTGREVCKFKPLRFNVPTNCNTTEFYKYLHESVHAAGQLIPIYHNALRGHNGTFTPIIEEENIFLKALNGENCLNPKGCFNSCTGQFYDYKSPADILTNDNKTLKVEAKLFAGVADITVNTIFVVPSKNQGLGRELYRDGVPHGEPSYEPNGDGTVLTESVIFNEYFPERQKLQVERKVATHSELIKVFAKSVVNFISDGELDRFEDLARGGPEEMTSAVPEIKTNLQN